MKLLHILLLLSFLMVYLAWGKENHAFVFEMEYQILSGYTDTKNVFMHPMVAMPFIGQLLLLFSIFQKKPNRKLTIAAIVLMGCLVAMCLLAGIFSKNLRIVGSTIPFIVLSWLVIKSIRNAEVPSNF